MDEKNMSALARACLSMIRRGRTNGLLDKINMFYLVGSLTEEEYTELKNQLTEHSDSV